MLSELCKLLGVDVPAALQLVKQLPGLLDTPSRALEANMQVSSSTLAGCLSIPYCGAGLGWLSPV